MKAVTNEVSVDVLVEQSTFGLLYVDLVHLFHSLQKVFACVWHSLFGLWEAVFPRVGVVCALIFGGVGFYRYSAFPSFYHAPAALAKWANWHYAAAIGGGCKTTALACKAYLYMLASKGVFHHFILHRLGFGHAKWNGVPCACIVFLFAAHILAADGWCVTLLDNAHTLLKTLVAALLGHAAQL